jgi:hypothetical protein
VCGGFCTRESTEPLVTPAVQAQELETSAVRGSREVRTNSNVVFGGRCGPRTFGRFCGGGPPAALAAVIPGPAVKSTIAAIAAVATRPLRRVRRVVEGRAGTEVVRAEVMPTICGAPLARGLEVPGSLL